MARCDAAAGGPQNESLLYQKWLKYIFDRAPLLRQSGSQTVDTNGAPVEFLNQREQQPAIQMIKTLRINIKQIKRRLRGITGHRAVCLHLGVIPHATQQAVGNAWRPP